MTLAEALGQGMEVTVIGLVIVFAVLIILMLVMMLMKVVFYNPTQPKQEKAKPTPKKKSTAGTPDDELMAVITAAVASAMDESELIAVLTAAVAASMNTSTYNLKIKSYRRVENTAPAWNKAGLRDVIDARI